jgi:hypothetical protein
MSLVTFVAGIVLLIILVYFYTKFLVKGIGKVIPFRIAKQGAIDVDSSNFHASTNEKLVLTQGTPTSKKLLCDEIFSIYSEGSYSLVRKVEMMQYRRNMKAPAEHKIDVHERLSETNQPLTTTPQPTTPMQHSKKFVPDHHALLETPFNRQPVPIAEDNANLIYKEWSETFDGLPMYISEDRYANPNTFIFQTLEHRVDHSDIRINNFGISAIMADRLFSSLKQVQMVLSPQQLILSPLATSRLLGSESPFQDIQMHRNYIFLIQRGSSRLDDVGNLRVSFWTKNMQPLMVCARQSNLQLDDFHFGHNPSAMSPLPETLFHYFNKDISPLGVIIKAIFTDYTELEKPFSPTYDYLVTREKFFNKISTYARWELYGIVSLGLVGFIAAFTLIFWNRTPAYKMENLVVSCAFALVVWCSINALSYWFIRRSTTALHCFGVIIGLSVLFLNWIYWSR